MLHEQVMDQQKNKYTSLSIAKVLMALAVYLISSATLLEHLSVVATLKTLGFMLCAHAFYFLWKSTKE
ncbi:MAG: hypothetical protein QM479_14295 [Pseudomonadota bacterium]